MRRPLSLAVVAALLVLMVLGAGQASAASSPAKSISALERQLKAVPDSVLKKKQRAKLVKSVRHARRVAKRAPCSAVADLARFRRVLRTVKIKKSRKPGKAAQRLADLGPSSLKATQQLLRDKKTSRCGGGQSPSTRAETKTTVMQSDENGMRVRVQLPVLRFVPETGGGQTWTKLVAPNTDSPGQPGKPGIPIVSSTFGVPDGATLKVVGTNATSYTIDGVDVFPAQPEPVDQDNPPPDFLKPPFATLPFQVDGAAYRSKAPVPASPADGAILGTARDVVIGNLQVPAAQYNPAAKTLKVFKSIDVNVSFEGGPHTFSSFLEDPWEANQRSFVATLLNSNVFRGKLVADRLRRCGEQMMVITSSATRAAADSFATAKRAQGMRTNVFETGAGSGQIGTTAAAIQTTIRSRLNAFLCIRPSYVTIMGDDDLVPTFPGINSIPSDLQYSMRDDADELPDVAVGRIIGNDQAAVQTAVNKIVTYETTPPTANGMLGKATIAAQFQDDDNNGQENRTFIQFAETVRNGLVARGNSVDRIYGEHPGNNPQKFNDGTNLPAALLKPTFAWNGTGAQVSTAWNEGRFMVIHRDHGYSDGWGTPSFSTSNVQALTNGANLPVLLSINCSSGAYDYDETSFAGESLVKPNGGAVGVFGDTRDSPTWHNTQIAFGFVDALLPSVLGGEGPATKQRTGNALIHGKLRLAGLAPPSGPGITGGDGSTRNELYLWHYFGDPSMQMWGGGVPPLVLDLSQFAAVFKREYTGPPRPDPPPYVVNVTLPVELVGQTVALLRGGDVIGKAVIGVDGKATVPAEFGDGSVKPGDLSVVIEPEGGPAVTKQVDGVTPEPPPTKTNTSLSQTCPTAPRPNNEPVTVSGTLSPAFAGASVVVRWTRPNGTTFDRTVPTNASGNWSSSIEPNDEATGNDRFGTWKARASYAGDDTRNGSAAEECSIVVFDAS